ncbi:MAG: hypothetical protein IJH04_02150 [Eggerthellaceae bacterium]|nr:hypothetical protein [Eggerthellaceae bacterium]
MIEQDYLMRLLIQFFQAMYKAEGRRKDEKDPKGAADMLEAAIGNATDMDGGVLLSLAPDSIAQVMKVSGVDPNVTQFVARSRLLESVYLTEANERQLAAVRAAQARAIADAYGFELPEDPSDFDAVTEGLEEAAEAGGFEQNQIGSVEFVAQSFDDLDEILASSGLSWEEPDELEEEDVQDELFLDDDRPVFGRWIDE